MNKNKPTTSDKDELTHAIEEIIEIFNKEDKEVMPLIKSISFEKNWNELQLLTSLKLSVFPVCKDIDEESTLIYPHQFNNGVNLAELVEARLLILAGILSAKIKKLEAEKKQLKLFDN